MTPNYDSFGYALAMRVLQSELYRQLDDRERAECDELIQRGMKPKTFNCREVPPGNGYCDMCAIGRFDRCRYIAHPKGDSPAEGTPR